MNKESKKWVLAGITALGGALGTTTEGAYAAEIQTATTTTIDTLANQEIATIPPNEQAQSSYEEKAPSKNVSSEEAINNATFEENAVAYARQSQTSFDYTSLSLSTSFSEANYENDSALNSEAINQSHSTSDTLSNQSALSSESNSLRASQVSSQSASASASQAIRSSNLTSLVNSSSESSALRISQVSSLAASTSTSQAIRSSNLASLANSSSESSSLRISQIGSLSASASTSQSYNSSTLYSTSNSASTSQYKKNSTLSSLSASASDSTWNANNHNADQNLIPSIRLDSMGGSGYLLDEVDDTKLYSFTDFLYSSPYLDYNPIDGYVKVPNLDTNSAFVNVWSGYKFSHAYYKGQAYQIGDRIYDEAFKDGNFEGLKFYFTPQEMTVNLSYGIYSQSQTEIDAFKAALSKANLPTSVQLKPGELVESPTIDIPGYQLKLKIIPTNIYPMPVPVDTPYYVVGTAYSSWVTYQYELIDS
ncbi:MULTISPECIES: hypothetical protein [unclassified Enterococcus]|uniref:hypothetical protein n=1 Tax=unclassified Enterococcus TaxID=2608891 RepID=UPI00155687B0|nr:MULTISPECIES: hypothetical protein [unclassified Enterococcus]MBS7577468.1 hypothetical protein [Enterococcus sp. MMGLQ5-2]MBS7584874.1 hypothetical protein [Enterococcus sp. MMGLQ5-1]NPD12729.1 hypothetical protein [Enterococcus sp. MMGLQ5-1]NPD37300.1 hypothetical protein [Enterococcus sp. MMGLQ5-2]